LLFHSKKKSAAKIHEIFELHADEYSAGYDTLHFRSYLQHEGMKTRSSLLSFVPLRLIFFVVYITFFITFAAVFVLVDFRKN